MKPCDPRTVAGSTRSVANTRPMAAPRRSKKQQIFSLFDALPVLREMGDPVIAGMLSMFAALVAIALVFATKLFPGDEDAHGHVLQVATGVVLLLGFYFAAINLRTARAQHYSDRLLRVFDQVNSSSPAIRLGAIRLLEGMAVEEPEAPMDAASRLAADARRRAIRQVLWALADEADDRQPVILARRVRDQLVADGFESDD
jgi:hypothetical protein